MKIKFKELGYGLLSLLLFQIALSIVSIKNSINFLQLKNYTGTSIISTPQLITEIIVSLLFIISIVLFIIKPKIGTTVYTASIIMSLISSLIFSSFDLENLLLSLLIPGLTLLLVYIKRNSILK